MSNDPHQLNNLAGNPEYIAVKERLFEALSRKRPVNYLLLLFQ